MTARIGCYCHQARFNPDNAGSRRRFTAQLAVKVRCEPNKLSGLDALIIKAANRVDAVAAANTPAESDPQILEAAERFLNNPDKFDELCSDFETLGIVGEADLATTVYLVGTSRLLDKPLAAVIQAPSSTGKSFVAEQVVDLMPPDAVVAATAFSSKSLYYTKRGGLKHKLVFLAERQHARARSGSPAANATLALRELLSKGDHLLSCINAVALLQQENREIVDGKIQATVEDYAVAYRLMMPVLRRTLCPVSEKQLDLLRQLVEKSGGQPFTMKQIEEWTGMKRTSINDQLKPLREQGLVQKVETAKRRENTFLISTEDTELSVGIDALVTPARLAELIDA